MPQASSLIQRNNNGSQLDSGTQLWTVQAAHGLVYNIGFEKEFVKKHLFCDPDPPADINAKANALVAKIDRYSVRLGVPAEAVPGNLDAASLRFLKLKKLVRARVTQGKCSVCGQNIGSHPKRCAHCDHVHGKPWKAGAECGFGGTKGAKGAILNGCTCTTWTEGAPGRIEAGGVLTACAGYVSSVYEQDRVGAGKANPFGSEGGACAGTNSVVLMDAIDLQTFKTTVAAAIRAREDAGWSNGGREEGVDFAFGAGTAVTIQSADTLMAFNARAAGSGISVDVKRTAPLTYKIYHLRALIP